MALQIRELIFLRQEQDDVRRGYRFEQMVREILPWDVRPPISATGPSEQFDAVFEWKSRHFIVEAKAKIKPIQRGSHDWEDFELKVRKRRGHCVGLFLSLFPVKEAVIDAANELCREGMAAIVIHGQAWDEIARERLLISEYVSYALANARIRLRSTVDRVDKIRDHGERVQQASERIHRACRKVSKYFLRSYADPRHNSVYVERHIDVRIRTLAEALRPSSLTPMIVEETSPTGAKYFVGRPIPPQFLLLRDFSGSGKTTLSAHIALSGSDAYIGAARAAREGNLCEIEAELERYGDDFGFEMLADMDKPIVFVVDSLDEVVDLPEARREIKALFAAVESLNRVANSLDHVAFPLFVVFTVREEYWRTWESDFEGMPVVRITRRHSQFTTEETEIGLDRYQRAYNYELASAPSDALLDVLSIPFNLGLFSETHEFEETVSAEDALQGKVVDRFFERKAHGMLKRCIPGFSIQIFYKLNSDLAMLTVQQGENLISEDALISTIESRFLIGAPHAEQVAIALLSDTVLTRDANNHSMFRFRHGRFIEYLVAYYIVDKFGEDEGRHMDETTELVLYSGIAQMYNVHGFVRKICAEHYPRKLDAIERYYSRSDSFMRQRLSQLRYEIALGNRTSRDDLDLIMRSIHEQAYDVARDAFYVFAAKNNNPTPEEITAVFACAWDANRGRPERYKFLPKIQYRGMLMCEPVIRRVVESDNWKEWQTFLGLVLDYKVIKSEFREIWAELAGSKQATLANRAGEEWEWVSHLLNLALGSEDLIPGSP